MKHYQQNVHTPYTSKELGATPKQLVLRRYPKAYAYRWAGPCPWVIYAEDGRGTSLNLASKTAAHAWRDAWARLRRPLASQR